MIPTQTEQYSVGMTETIYYRSNYTYYPGVLAQRVISVVIGVIEAILLVRIVLELLGASAASPFVSWIYNLSGALLGPFSNAFPNLAFGTGVLDIAAILAIIVYAIIGWVISMLLSAIFNSVAAV